MFHTSVCAINKRCVTVTFYILIFLHKFVKLLFNTTVHTYPFIHGLLLIVFLLTNEYISQEKYVWLICKNTFGWLIYFIILEDKKGRGSGSYSPSSSPPVESPLSISTNTPPSTPPPSFLNNYESVSIL